MKRHLLTQRILVALAAAGTTAEAATIPVTTTASGTNNADGQCSLAEAIDNANDDAATHSDCAAGSGADTIELPAGQVITLQERLPIIDSDITIEGLGATVGRDTSLGCDATVDPNRFGIFGFLDSESTLRSMTIRDGCEQAINPLGLPSQQNVAGAIVAQESQLTLNDVNLVDNQGFNPRGAGDHGADSK